MGNEEAGENVGRRLAEAEALQRDLADLVELRPLKKAPRLVAAVDADYGDNCTYAAAVLCDYRNCSVPIERKTVVRPTPFPYLPGYLALREAPAALDALCELSRRPDVLLVDGQGIAHPRRFGIACHLGVVARLPTIGCAKTHLIGTYLEPGERRGEWSPLRVDGEVVGAVLRTQTDVKPVFVSPGHLVTLQDAIEVVLHCSPHYRVPEPLRLADMAARGARRGALLPGRDRGGAKAG